MEAHAGVGIHQETPLAPSQEAALAGAGHLPPGPGAPGMPMSYPPGTLRHDGQPAWLDIKFRTVEDLQRSYHELERHASSLGAPNPPQPGMSPPGGYPPAAPPAPGTPPGIYPPGAIPGTTPPPPGTPPGTMPPPGGPPPAVPPGAPLPPGAQPQPGQHPPTEPHVDPMLAGVPEPMRKYVSEYSNTGRLSDQSYLELQQQGWGRSFVDNFIQGQTALVQQGLTDLFSVTGGEEGYREMIDWARSGGCDPRWSRWFDAEMSSQDFARMQNACARLHGVYMQTGGSQPRPMDHHVTTPTIPGTEPAFGSADEMLRWMNDPRYDADPQFRDMVDKRVHQAGFMALQHLR